jgi:hypothetical protein
LAKPLLILIQFIAFTPTFAVLLVAGGVWWKQKL